MRGYVAVLKGTGALLGLALAAGAPKIERPNVPKELEAPAGEEVVLRAHAKGVQIYSCTAGGDGKYAWTLKAPKAELFDDHGKRIGKHFAGPTWKLNDGSEVTGTKKHDAPKAGAIPWLLIDAKAHKGSGALEHVTTIQRVNTKGGVVDATKVCDASKKDTETESTYSADYYFYAKQ